MSAAARPAALPGWVAGGATFLCSGVVLVLEIVGLRLVAPYVGVTLETSTAVIGFALAAIAIGAWSGVAEEPAGQRHLVVGDAFGGLSVPWQLTTVEALRLVDRALTEDGVYVANLIDHPPMGFVRAELATLREVFPHVLLLARPVVLDGGDGGNVVVVASRSPLPVDALEAAMEEHRVQWVSAGGDELDAFVGDAPVLTDDRAPVDQLLTTYGS